MVSSAYKGQRTNICFIDGVNVVKPTTKWYKSRSNNHQATQSQNARAFHQIPSSICGQLFCTRNFFGPYFNIFLSVMCLTKTWELGGRQIVHWKLLRQKKTAAAAKLIQMAGVGESFKQEFCGPR